MRVAVVDIGTNSTRLLVADVAQGKVTELDRRTSVTRLGEGVDATGRLADAAMARVYDTVAGYRQRIEELRPEAVIALATSATRDAANGDEFRTTLVERFGLEARIISGDEEARLTFLGATSTRSPEDGPVLVIDIGGGSTELVVGDPGQAPAFFVSTPAGSVRQTERFLHSDPPGHEEMARLASEVRDIMTSWVPEDVRRRADAGMAVAGTATSLAAIDQELDPYDPERVHGHRLGLEDCERMMAMLATLPLEERREVTGLHPDRAPTIVAGSVILVETMRAFELDEVEVSEADILHGGALATASTSNR